MSDSSHTSTKVSRAGAGDEIDLGELFMVVSSGRWVISIFTVVALAASIAVALVLPNIYSANALLAPAEKSGGGMSAMMQQYGGLASLAGVSLPDDDGSARSQLGMQLMKSRAFIGNFVEQRGILPELFATTSWDPDTNKIRFDKNVYDPVSKQWVRDVEPPRKVVPSAQEAHKAFMGLLSVSQNKDTSYVTVAIEHQSPMVAAQWVTWLVEDVNAAVKAQEVSEAKKSIQYLREQVANTSLADLQAVFFELIQSQTETVMLAEVRQEFVFKTIDPAVAPEEISKPNRFLVIFLGTFVGSIFGIIAVLLRHYVVLK